jgi:hypothetical protein
VIQFQIVEQPGADLHRQLVRAMRGHDLRTFEVKNRGRRVQHITYPGWMNWHSEHGVIHCEVLSPRKPGAEWQLFSAFIGRLANRYAASVAAINVQFPDAAPAPKKKKKARRKP